MISLGDLRKNIMFTKVTLINKIINGSLKKVDYVKIPRNKGFINNDMIDSLEYSLTNYLSSTAYSHKPQLKVFFNDKKKATTLIDGDNVVVVKTKKGEKYNRRIGFLEAYFELKSGMSKTQKNKYLDEVIKEEK
jgi:hypothetical protein